MINVKQSTIERTWRLLLKISGILDSVSVRGHVEFTARFPTAMSVRGHVEFSTVSDSDVNSRTVSEIERDGPVHGTVSVSEMGNVAVSRTNYQIYGGNRGCITEIHF